MKDGLKVRDSFVVNALRNCGYTYPSAIADIIDNSLEKDVESKNVYVKFGTERVKTNTVINKVLIIDDGNGMDSETLKEAMYLGAETGKNPEMDLGMYGTGMKASSLSMGQTLRVFTKKEEAESVLMSYMSVKSFYDGSLEKKVVVCDEPIVCGKESAEYADFVNLTSSEHGTIVEITDLDRFPTTYKSVKETLVKQIGKIFNKFIKNGDVKIFVGNVEVPPRDPMGSCPELLGSGSFKISGTEIRYNAYFATATKIDEDSEESDEEYDNTEINKQGCYVYRSDRLVGEHLSLFFQKHPSKRNFRCEIFMDGTGDRFFGSTFTKTISDTSRASVSQSLRDKLSNELKPYVLECQRREKSIRNEKKASVEALKEQKAFYEGVAEKQNKNRFLKGLRKGINTKNADEENSEEKEHKERGKQKNPNPTKTRKDIWLGGFEEMPLGRRGNIVEFHIKNARPFVIINSEHPFYTQVYSNLNNEMKAKIAQAFSCIEIAKQEAGYYSNQETEQSVDEFLLMLSLEVAKSLDY